MEKKYPVKYALLPVKTRRMNNKEELFVDECYIVSKAYVMEEHRKYREDGEYSVNYKLLFPYLAYSNGLSEEREPSDYLHKNREVIAFSVFDTLEEAEQEKDRRNVLVSQEVIDKYKPLETEILELTKHMVVNSKEGRKVYGKRI